jgi:hypothetical protein
LLLLSGHMSRFSAASAVLLLVCAPGHHAKRNYAIKPSHAFHNDLRLAVRDKRDGLIVAFLDDSAPTFAEEEKVFNAAARSFGCLPPGGTHAMLTREDDRALFIASDLREEHGLPDEAVPPLLAYYVNERIMSWTSALAAVPHSPSVANHTNWSESELTAWAYWAVARVRIVKDSADLSTMTHAADSGRAAVGFFERLCEGDARTYMNALAAANKQARGEGEAALNAAVSTNVSLGHETCPHTLEPEQPATAPKGAVCALVGERGARVRMPSSAARTVAEMADWLSGMAGAATGSEEEAPVRAGRGDGKAEL